MFSLYTEDEPNHKIGFSSYKTIFYKNFNLRRKVPVKDTCNLCDSFNAKIKNFQHDVVLREEQELQHKQHLLKAQEARESMKHDMEEAKTNNKLETATYDIEKVLGLPKLPTNIVYYKRQLSIYNEGVHTSSNDTPYCFVWKEGTAGRGAQEVGSCLKKFVDMYLTPETEELILWSDSCGGQNRNIKIVLLLKAILEAHPLLKTIYLKYLIPGHSFLPNDTDFGEIERSIKYQIHNLVFLASSSKGTPERLSQLSVDEQPEAASSSAKRSRGMINIFNDEKVVAALDKSKVSNRDAVHLAAAIVQSLRIDLETVTLNMSSVRLARQKVRDARAIKIKTYFKTMELKALVLHSDGKLMEDVNKREKFTHSSGKWKY
ncbi:unnamed protein product [Brassicogethes aeneus]|uniref:Uncharacterized protein n=1 Tax=Brassicogethes aeneus TaxID=1431903 RepID=A0A9P0FGJ0_BRAAE|nr:unnamed protein product [Brassicogethes aeneus]